VFPTADYMVCSIECSLVQKEAIRQELHLAMQERFHRLLEFLRRSLQ
jgi:hypothetical protein